MFRSLLFLIAIGLSTFWFYAPAMAQSSAVNVSKKQALPVIFAVEGVPLQAAIDFYKEVYKGLGRSTRWEPMPISLVRKALDKSGDEQLGGIPTIDRNEFRSKLPRRRKVSKLVGSETGRIIPGRPVPQLQRFLDNTRSPAVLVVDCARMSPLLLKACGLYYYDRVSSRVIASAVKEFVSGASDITIWADPMLKTLENGLEAAQREKDQELIQELVARNEQDDVSQIKGLVAFYFKGDRAQLNSGFRKSLAGAGLQLGFLDDSVGAVVDGGILSWKGDGEGFEKAERSYYGINMVFRARALESLLWFLELGGGKEKTIYTGTEGAGRYASDGIYAFIGPGVGIELAEYASLNIGAHWRWFFESSSERRNVALDLSQTESRIPGVSLRAMFLF